MQEQTIIWKNHSICRSLRLVSEALTRRKFVQKDVCLESGDIRFDTLRREAYAKREKWYL